MKLSIKLQDIIWISAKESKITWSPNYDVARKSIEELFDMNSLDNHPFEDFVTTIFKTFKPKNAHNLYYLADANLIVKNLIIDYEYNTLNTQIIRFSDIPPINFLNFFGFEIDKIPTKKQVVVLEDLKKQNIVEYYWLENDIRMIEPKTNPRHQIKKSKSYFIDIEIYKDEIDIEIEANFSQSLNLTNEQDYVLDLGLNKNNEKRGLGATIIDFEYDATDNLDLIRKNQYLKNLFPNTKILGSMGQLSNNNLTHQDSTLTALFAKTPPNESFKIFGLAPEANLIVCSLLPDSEKDLLKQFEKRKLKLNDILRKKLVELGGDIYQNSILLFEFELDIITGPNPKVTENSVYPTVTYPAVIIPDVSEALLKLSNNNLNIGQRGKNIISVVAAGNKNRNFDEDFKNKKNKAVFGNFTYTDLKIANPGFMMIGVGKKNETTQKYEINKRYNNAGAIEAYFYDQIKLQNMNVFEATSAATAIVAGIVAYLQGKALIETLNKQPLTIDIFKKLVKKTFMKNFPNNVLSPFNLKDLWQECENELKLNASQHQ